MLAIMLAACTAGEAPAPAPRFVEGDVLPPVTMQKLDGGAISLDDFGERIVVLNVWATWCGPCRRELPSLERLAQQLDPAHFAVIALSIDTDDHLVREYLIDKQIHLPAYRDPERHIASGVLGVTVYPDTFIIAPGRRYVHHVVGDRVWDTPAVVAALQGVRVGGGVAPLRLATAPPARPDE